jgi:hypothetical protein
MTARPPVWVHELATGFWADAGDPPPSPRDLREVCSFVPDLHVVEVCDLTTPRAAAAFAKFNVPCAAVGEVRRLRGCFGAANGLGVILIDPADPADERRFTLAHELAHFLRDFRAPRARALKRLGNSILPVLNGERPATPDERLSGALRGVALGARAHYLARDGWGRVADEDARDAEDAADRLAYELLAPFDALNPDSYPSRAALVCALVSTFGLPALAAKGYAASLGS